MSRWLICGNWELEVEFKPGEGPHVQNGPFYQFPLRDLSRHASCRQKLIALLPPGGRVFEAFGGLGLSSLMYREMLHPTVHRVLERAPELVEHLRRAGFAALQGDALNLVPQLGAMDILDLDFGRFTVHQWAGSDELRGFTDRVFRAGHQNILFTDEATVGFFPNRKIYEGVLGCPLTSIQDYVNGWSALWAGLYGYRVVAAERHRGAVYTLWRAGDYAPLKVNKTQADCEGVAIVSP